MMNKRISGWLFSPALLILILGASDSTSTESPSTASDLVFIQLDKSSFNVGQIVDIAIQNGMDKPIYTEDMKCDCSIVFLERWVGIAWQQILGCTQRRAPAIVKLEAGQEYSLTIDFAHPNFSVASEVSTSAIGTGTYRIRFSYRLAPEPEGEEPLTVYSQEFKILP